MTQNKDNLWKFVGLVFVAYVIIWFWPVVFHRPFFNDYRSDVMPYEDYADEPVYPNTYHSFPAYGPDIRIEYKDEYDPVVYDNENPAPPSESDEGMKMCTMEAKECPDGSYVGRTGPNCEFTKCPDDK